MCKVGLTGLHDTGGSWHFVHLRFCFEVWSTNNTFLLSNKDMYINLAFNTGQNRKLIVRQV